jgi:hypothetical protein
VNGSDNMHRVETEYSQRTHWKSYHGNMIACGWQDEPERIELTPPSGSWPQLAFDMPRQRHELERVEYLMKTAYDAGQRDKMREISRMFKNIIGI